jgi:outer membrane receptor protein involved in Fe transport
LTYRIGDFEVLLHASMYKRASPYNSDFVSPEADFNDPNNYEIDRSASFDVKHRLSFSAVAELRSRLYGDSFDYRRQADVSAFGPDWCDFTVATCRKKEFGASRWIGLEEQASFDWFKDASFVTLLGVDGRLRSILSQEDVVDAANDRPLASSTAVLRKTDEVVAAYAQQTWNPTPWLGLNGGGRFDYDPRFGGHVSPRVAASTQPWRRGTLRVIYSDAFRAPSWEESSITTSTQIPSGQLLPETVRSISVAAEQQLGSHRLLFAVFRSWWNDMVALDTLSQAELFQAQSAGLLSLGAASATQYRNVSSIDDVGFNAGYEGSFAEGRLRYGVNVTGAMARRTNAGVDSPLPVAPQIFGNARVSYALPGDLPTVGVAGRYLGTRPVDEVYGASILSTPYAPAFAELRGTLSGVVAVLRGLSYRTSVDYAFTDRGPYVIGPFQTGVSATSTDTRVYPKAPELNPIDRFRVTVGLQYDF